MLSIFRTNQLMISILLLFYAAVLHISAVVAPAAGEPAAGGYLSHVMFGLIGKTGLYPAIAATVMVFIQGFFLNVMEFNYRLAREVNMLPGVFYILIASAAPEFLRLSPLHPANFFLFIALYELMGTYKQPNSADNIFNTGFWLGVASLFYPPYLVFVLLIYTGLNILRGFSLKERLMVAVGVIVPYILAGVYCFWTDQWGDFWKVQFADSFGFFRVAPGQSWPFSLIVWGFIILLLLAQHSRFMLKRTIQTQKRINLLYWAMVIGLLTLPIQNGIRIEHFLVVAVPLGYLFSMEIMNLRSNWAELIHFLLLLMVAFFQYQSLLF